MFNLAPIMAEQAIRDRVYYHAHQDSLGVGHWSEAGHRAAADLIAGWLPTAFPDSDSLRRTPTGVPRPSGGAMVLRLQESLERHLSILACPACQADLALEDDGLRCLACKAFYRTADNIPLLFCPNQWDRARDDVTMTVKSFYEETPFPNYDEFDNVGWLRGEGPDGGCSPSSWTTRSRRGRGSWNAAAGRAR